MICGRTDQNGFYRVFENDTQISSIPVNTDPRESNLDSLNNKTTAGAVANIAHKISRGGDDGYR